MTDRHTDMTFRFQTYILRCDISIRPLYFYVAKLLLNFDDELL